MTKTVISPLTNTDKVNKIDSIAVSDIIKMYKRQVGIDISRFFEGISFVDIYECMETGYKFYYPPEIISDGKFYEDFQKKCESENTAYYRTGEFDHLYAASVIQKDDRVLDIGSGNGSFLKMLLPKTANCTGLELNAYTAEICRNEGLEIFNELVENHIEKRSEYYDVVCSFQVLEHVYEVKSFIFNALKALRPGGKLIISVPNNEPWFLRYSKYETLNLPPHHMGLWNKEVFKKLQTLFPINLKDVIYSGSYRWQIDAYYRARNWAGVKSLIHQHTLNEKIRIGLLLPFSAPISILDKMNGKIRGGQICVHFEKNKL